MSLKSRTWAGFGAAALAGMVLAPVAGAATPQAPAPAHSHKVSSVNRGIPTFPGLDASDPVIQEWINQLVAKYHLPKPPGDNASPEQLEAYGQQLISALHLPPFPGDDATDAEAYAWVNKAVVAIGMPPLPGMNASDAAWEAWFTKAFGMTPQQLVNKVGAVGQFGDQVCSHGKTNIEVAAINFSNLPVTLAEVVDGKLANAAIHLKASSLDADEPQHYEGTLPVPAGKHTVSLVNTASGKVLDVTVTTGSCAGKPANTLPTSGSSTAVPSAPSSTHSTKVSGPVVQTDYTSTGQNTSAMIALAGGAILLLTGSGAMVARARRN